MVSSYVVMAQSKQLTRLQPWHHQLIDWWIAHPRPSGREAAAHFGKSEAWISRVQNSPIFRAEFEKRCERISQVVYLVPRDRARGPGSFAKAFFRRTAPLCIGSAGAGGPQGNHERNMATAQLDIQPISVNLNLKGRIYDSLKQAITSMNIYADGVELRLDERQLSEELEISRTPIREALARLEQEGLVHIVSRKGVYIVRKTKKEILDMITVWAALESMAARLITEQASDREISTLRRMFATFEDDQVQAHIDEYSETNIEFHQAIVKMSRCKLLEEMADNLFIHMRSIRARTISENNRAHRSIIDHMHIIEALEARDTELAERLARDHTLNLAAHVKRNVHYLD